MLGASGRLQHSLCRCCYNRLPFSLPSHHPKPFTHSRHFSTPPPVPDTTLFPAPYVRNFCIIAHIDHGKSTLTSRLLEMAGTIAVGQNAVDKLQVEQDRGITVKASTSSMVWTPPNADRPFLLNLIDTPGHVDFHYEVSRALAACQGALLVVDAVKGVQAQTLANFYAAFEMDLTIIPVINKIDQQFANPERVLKQLSTLLDFDPERVLKISAKTGQNVDQIFPRIISDIPAPPSSDPTASARIHLIDSWHDTFRGVVLLVQIVDGSITSGIKISSAHSNKTYEVQECGVMFPSPRPTRSLMAGQVGYVIPNMKSCHEALVGDTFFDFSLPLVNRIPLPGFRAVKPMVFASLYPVDTAEFEKLADAVDKISLTDASVTFHRETSTALGIGFRCGFLGMLHASIFQQRLKNEYAVDVITTAPQVRFRVLEKGATEYYLVESANQFPDPFKIQSVEEPVVDATIIAPSEFLGPVINMCQDRRGTQKEITHMDSERIMIRYTIPLAEIVMDFFDELKGLTHGYASLDYEDAGFQSAKISKLAIMINSKPVDALATLVHADRARARAVTYVAKLKEAIDRQMFEIAIQASLDGKIIARETIKAMRKDVTAKCYGGDITRRKKLLEKQKEGKKLMKRVGNVDIPQEAFLTVLKR
eukprot:c1378_g1_i1.p1 GENE.c1378_g1_i1~~c1378_g1_i1.p1  ORF type:complete len:649 (-),score=153.95 c1378_g1_i1:155-2101(-)